MSYGRIEHYVRQACYGNIEYYVRQACCEVFQLRAFLTTQHMKLSDVDFFNKC